jgi:hypothetical protein
MERLGFCSGKLGNSWFRSDYNQKEFAVLSKAKLLYDIWESQDLTTRRFEVCPLSI